MRHFLTLSILLLCTMYAIAQSRSTVSIKGVVKDSVKNTALAYATVTVKDAATDSAMKSAATKEKGDFEITIPGGKRLKLIFASVGFTEKQVDIPLGTATVDVGTIVLAPTSGQLKDVVVTATRPLIRQEVDRVVFDVQADPENKVNTALDMLRKVPMVSVDGSDNIKLKGNSNYKILINGKPSSILASNPADIFRSMPASNIIKIEVITTPPAKYDAEGLAGIINIITKKNADQGYNGSINTRYSDVWGPGINVNATIKQGKFGLNGYIGTNRQNKLTTKAGYNSTFYHPISSYLAQTSDRTAQRNNTFGNAELSFTLDTLNLITASIEGYRGSSNNGLTQFTQQLASDNTLDQQYGLTQNGTSGYHGLDLSLNYELGFKRNKEQLLTTSYKYGSSGNNQNTNAAFSERLDYGLPNYRQVNNSGTREHTAQLDFVYPLKTLNIEAGAKAIFRKNFSEFTTDNYNEDIKQFVNDPVQTNNFKYLQNVYSVYNSYQLKLKKTVFKGGLRVERTTVNADFTSTASVVKTDYNNFVPSLSFQQTLSNSQSITLGYSQRIQRPGIWQLNPFVDRSNPKFISVGNPNLQPVVSRNIELNYSRFKKGSITAGISYSFANNTVENVTSVGADTVTTSSYLNVGSNRGLSVNLDGNYPITSRLNLNVNSQLLHVWLKGTFNNQFYYNKGFQGHIFTYTSHKFDKGYRAGLNLGFDSRYVLLQGRDNYYIFSSLSGSKTLFKEKATLSLSVNNPYRRFFKVDFYTNSPDFSQRNYFENYYRAFIVSFNYKFGKLNSAIKKNQRGISNDDVNNQSRQ